MLAKRLVPLALAFLVFALPRPAGAQVVGISLWYGYGNTIAVGMRDGVVMTGRNGLIGPTGNALVSRPAGEWLAGFCGLNSSNSNEFQLFGVTNTGRMVVGTAGGGWGNGRDIFADTGRAPSQPIAMEGGTNSVLILTASGDLFEVLEASINAYPAEYRGNIGGQPTAAFPATWGKLKADYRK